MYLKSLHKSNAFKYRNLIANHISLLSNNEHSVNPILGRSHRLYSHLFGQLPRAYVSSSLESDIHKKLEIPKIRQQNIQQSTKTTLYKNIHCCTTAFKNTSEPTSREPYKHESPELRDILNELYKENDPEVSTSKDRSYKGK